MSDTLSPRPARLRIIARCGPLLLTVALLAVACGGDTSTDAPAVGTGPDASDSDDRLAGPGLVIGWVLPETGTLAHLGPSMVTSVQLALDDITAAGGNVSVIGADSATDPSVAATAVNRLLGEGVHAVMGAAASGVSQSFIQTLFESQIPQCSGANTSSAFSTQENAEFYFRTVTSTLTDAPVLADTVIFDGATKVAIINRADSYGISLALDLSSVLDEFGVENQVLPYAPTAPSFDATVSEAVSFGADTFVMIAFAEGVQIIRGLLERGVPASVIYGGVGSYDLGLPERVNPANPRVLDGFKLVTPYGGDQYNQRLADIIGPAVAFGAQVYDCVIVLALAALSADSTAGPVLVAEVAKVTRGGQKCFSYAECAALIVQGVDVDYDGASGPLDINEVGDVTLGRFAVLEAVEGEIVVARTVEVDAVLPEQLSTGE